MIANYHTHTPRCRHATGTEAEYVQSALERNLKILGFSDHSPYWFPGDYYSGHRMYPEELGEYSQVILGLRDRYAGKLEIHLGLEAEYYPDLFPAFIQRVRDFPIEYLILGQHALGNEQNDHWAGSPTDDESCIRRYCTQVCDAMQTGLFTYLAHPDICNYIGDDRIYTSYMRTLCREAKSCHMPLEINLLGVRENRHYPNLRFWEIAAEENCQVIIGCDAHTPQALQDVQSEENGMQLVKRFGLDLAHTIPLRSIR